MSHGFKVLLCDLEPSYQWESRDPVPEKPLTKSEFLEKNQALFATRDCVRKPDVHWETMREELVKERKTGRVRGPLKLPTAWGLR